MAFFQIFGRLAGLSAIAINELVTSSSAASAYASALESPTISPIRQNLSSIFGSISFSCWIILMVPQLVEQWRLKTVDGISPVFLLMWTFGDIFNLIGAIWAGLLPEVIIIALWFLFADLFTLAFYFYISISYDKKRKAKHAKKHPNSHIVVDDERLLLGEHAIHYEHEVPTLTDTNPETISSDYGSTIQQQQPHHQQQQQNHRRQSAADRRKSHSSTLDDIVYEPENHSIFVKYTLPILLVILSGLFGSILSPNGTSSAPADPTPEPPSNDTLLGPQICGYLSAFLYLTARFPQIYHNYNKKSTKGLSLLFFLFTMLGNITYSLQIVVYRSDYEYLMLNLSWLLGSFGTIAEDLIIVAQFYLYKS